MANKKKVFDVIPPSEETQKVAVAKKVPFVKKVLLAKKAPKKISKQVIVKKVSRSKKVPIFIGVGIVLGIAVLCFVLIKPQVVVTIWPEKTQVQFETQVIVDSSVTEILLNEQNFMPGKVFTKEQASSQEFSSTGKKIKSTKAQGTITVYNAYSTSKLSLIAQTRFVSDDGKLFRTPQRVVVPGGHYEGGKLIPGEVDIVVEAGEPGEEYNIGPSTFSIPGFAGTPRYTAFYARSFEPMSGGMKQEVTQITQDDLDRAEEILTTKALTDCQIALEDAVSQEEYIMVEEALVTEITEISPLAEAGQEKDSFTFQVKTEGKALVFQRQDMRSFVQAYIKSQIPQEKEFVDNSITINYLPQAVDFEEGKIFLDLEISAEIYSKVDEGSVKETIKDIRPDEVSGALRKFSEIKKVEAKLGPFWVQRLPQNTERINIILNLD